MQNKALLRKDIRARLTNLFPAERAGWDAAALARIIVMPEFLAAERVGCYASMPEEFQTGLLLEVVWKRGKVMALPRVRDDVNLDFHIVTAPGQLQPGALGILEPDPAQCPILPPTELQWLLVPGLAFDHDFRRLGRGKGYYDRYLAKTFALKVAACYECQRLPALHGEAHDRPVDILVTETAIYRRSPA